MHANIPRQKDVEFNNPLAPKWPKGNTTQQTKSTSIEGTNERPKTKEKIEKNAREQQFEEGMRKRLAKFGFQENQIEGMVNPKDELEQGKSSAKPLPWIPTQEPTYVKVHKDHLAIDTLIYYNIPYEIDRSDPNYIIILSEMGPRETEILFEHTRRLRNRGASLLLENRNADKRPEHAWVGRRTRRNSLPSLHKNSDNIPPMVREFSPAQDDFEAKPKASRKFTAGARVETAKSYGEATDADRRQNE
ncbi:uncharacterized protein BDR25DRAFT_291688 [Lindgomyces ingoldianus]|uniref:Uncharacterized protein n=1 Tax=Lindgomyces ingoldianus TaxID=673940 RepID=A0ACB6QLD8_9PLEO|nr:uncharacterized protein BDR25DRAFT_291688 [Lindgomyces ingoldianus]KAF2467711.1 hypothetical protein BDR25DRAFT_291688 [Lindgomyces ingoldianus]